MLTLKEAKEKYKDKDVYVRCTECGQHYSSIQKCQWCKDDIPESVMDIYVHIDEDTDEIIEEIIDSFSYYSKR